MQGKELLRKCANIFWFGNILYILRTLFDDIYFSELAMQVYLYIPFGPKLTPSPSKPIG